MNATSLERKTIRPGSLVGYSYYRSNRRPYSAAKTKSKKRGGGNKSIYRRVLAAALILLALVGLPLVRGDGKPANRSASKPAKTAPAVPPAKTAVVPAAAAAAAPNHCADNKLNQLILVNTSQRHLWACQDGKTVYDSAVITGIQLYDATLTPPGTYRIYAKRTNLTLTGSDLTGSWSDPVQYWMPFLDNPYGTYGFHDATWRPDSAFGNISPTSSDASHGCVELPLAASAWLYNWAQVGTTVTIES